MNSLLGQQVLCSVGSTASVGRLGLGRSPSPQSKDSGGVGEVGESLDSSEVPECLSANAQVS